MLQKRVRQTEMTRFCVQVATGGLSASSLGIRPAQVQRSVWPIERRGPHEKPSRIRARHKRLIVTYMCEVRAPFVPLSPAESQMVPRAKLESAACNEPRGRRAECSARALASQDLHGERCRTGVRPRRSVEILDEIAATRRQRDGMRPTGRRRPSQQVRSRQARARRP